jgi:hypothetical protein
VEEEGVDIWEKREDCVEGRMEDGRNDYGVKSDDIDQMVWEIEFFCGSDCCCRMVWSGVHGVQRIQCQGLRLVVDSGVVFHGLATRIENHGMWFLDHVGRKQ